MGCDPVSYFIGVCGHRVPLLPSGHLVPCPCDKPEPDSTPCPHCGNTSGVQPITGTSPKVEAWTCTECRTSWATSIVNPGPDYLTQLCAAVVHARSRWLLADIIELAADDTLTDAELRARLTALGTRAEQLVAAERS